MVQLIGKKNVLYLLWKKKLLDWAGTKTFIRSTEGNRHKCISLICDFVEDLGMETDGGTDDEKNGSWWWESRRSASLI